MVATVVVAVVVLYGLWITGSRPWMLRPQVPVPAVDEALVVQWQTFEQDINPIPWT